MSAIVPPFNRIPELPVVAITKLIERLNKQVDQLTNSIQKLISDAIQLPEGCGCNDPRVDNIKQSLAKIQNQINGVQSAIGKLKTIIATLNKIVTVTKSIKAATAIAQLINPLTAGPFIAAQITLIQDATIVNAINSIKLLNQIPLSLDSALAALATPLMDAVAKLSVVCGGDTSNKISLPKSVVNAMNDNGNNNGGAGNTGVRIGGSGISINGIGTGIGNGVVGNGIGLEDADFDYNDLLGTEFYKDVNVSDFDLDDRAEQIQRMLEQQQNLYKSIIEAPSRVYDGAGAPVGSLGKIGDFYVDTQNNVYYGPKMTKDSWT
jgi:hypothetical protein